MIRRFGMIKMILALMLMVVVLTGCTQKPLNSSITVAGIEISVQQDQDCLYAKTGDIYYKLYGSNAFSQKWCFDEWEVLPFEEPQGEPLISFRLAELYIVEFYEGGRVFAHNGYASKGTQSSACYAVPSTVVTALLEHLRSNETPCDPYENGFNSRSFDY